MDERKAKLELARKKLKDHQEKKSVVRNKGDLSEEVLNCKSNLKTDVNINNGISTIQNINEHDSMDSLRHNESTPSVSAPGAAPEAVSTAALVSYQRSMEIQITDLLQKIEYLENVNDSASKNIEMIKQHNSYLQAELSTLQEQNILISKELALSEKSFSEHKAMTTTLDEEKNNLIEHLELTKEVVSKRESEISTLSSTLEIVQHELELAQLQLQQVNSGISEKCVKSVAEEKEKTESLVQKISYLEQQLKVIQNERNQITSHYEHYVSELNEEKKLLVIKNEEILSQVQYLTSREGSLIEQISDLEIQVQHLKGQKIAHEEMVDAKIYKDMENQYTELKTELLTLQKKYEEVQLNLAETQEKIIHCEQRNYVLEEKSKSMNGEETICLVKLNADMASDKVAAQRATEQNRKLKKKLQELEDDFVKISKDKLELTEKLEAEKFLNKELTLKLAEVVEKYEEAKTRVNAKDEEMMRLQSTYRDIERKLQPQVAASCEHSDSESACNHEHHSTDDVLPVSESHAKTEDNHESHKLCHNHLNNHNTNNNDLILLEPKIPKEDAMLKLQDRFLKIMDEVADLSDEKHRLEHIITQLQTETDTICEYVALYQQQRSLLKKRDEDRGEQLVKFQAECEKLRGHLGKLTEIILKLTENKGLVDSHGLSHEDIERALSILQNIENSFIVNPKNKCDMKDFYPCACCSGVLIDV